MTLLLSAALAGTSYFQLDNLQEGGNATVQGGFIAGECWGSWFPTADQGTFVPLGVDVLIGGASTDVLFVVEVYQSNDNFKVGQRIDDEAFYLTSTDDGAMNRLVFEEAEMVLPPMTGNVGIAICFDQHDYWPGPAHDVGLNHPNQQKIFADVGTGSDEWWGNAEVGISGDWVLRLCIEGDDVTGTECPEWQGGGGDADTDADTDSDTDTDVDSDTDLDDSGFGFGLLAITPDSAPEGESVDVVITGMGFDYDAEARIGGINLIGQQRLGAETLTGRSPSSLPVGVHDVEVIRGDGTSDVLVGAFEVGGGCGCGTVGGAGGLLVLLAPLVAVRRRR